MDWTSILLAVAAGLGLGWLLMRSNSVDYTKIHIINPTDFKNNMRKGQLVDLRKADAYEQDRIKGARTPNCEPTNRSTCIAKTANAVRKSPKNWPNCPFQTSTSWTAASTPSNDAPRGAFLFA
jgi:rhodanese-related sulfurtransferase